MTELKVIQINGLNAAFEHECDYSNQRACPIWMIGDLHDHFPEHRRPEGIHHCSAKGWRYSSLKGKQP